MRRQFSRAIAAAVLAIVVGVFAILTYELQRSRELELRYALHGIDNNALSLQSQAENIVRRADLLLSEAQRLVQSTTAASPAPAVNAELARLLAHLPEAQSLRAAGADGAFRFDANNNPSAVRISDRPYFQRLRDDPQAGLVVSQPFHARITNNWVITLSRRLVDRQGHFAGLVQVAISADFFRGRLRSIDDGSSGRLALYVAGSDGPRLLVSEPALAPEAGQLASSSLVLAAARETGGSVWNGRETENGETRLVVVRRVQGAPLLIVASQALDEALAGWHRQAFFYALSGLALLAILVSLLLLWQRKFDLITRLAERRGKAHAETSSRMQALLAGIPDLAWMRDGDGRFQEVNAAYASHCGLPAASIIGKTVFDVWPVHLAGAMHEHDLEVLRTRLPVHAETVTCDSTSGRLHVLDSIYVPVFGQDGELVGTAGLARDITERKETEEKLALWAKVFSHAHEGIIVTDANGTIIDINDTYARLSGYAREELLGQNPRLLRSGEHDQEFYVAMWRELLENGSWRGEIVNRSKGGELYHVLLAITAVRDGSGATTHYVGLAHDISDRRNAEQRLERMAYYDTLTGLPNRTLLADRMHQAMAQADRENFGLAVCYLDLDGFKQVNDVYGHAVGDRLLEQVAERLQAGVRTGDTVARLGGDEFVLVLVGLSGIEECDHTLRRLLKELARPFEVVPGGGNISGSIGVTFYPQDGGDPDTLLRHADQALYIAKEAGRNRYQLFDTEQDKQARDYRDALARIEEGLEKREFVLYYQPKVHIRTGAPIGVEALIRWQHPDGMLLPAEFMPLVEDTPLAVSIGEWVIETALIQIAEWGKLGLPLPISVNLSARHLQSPGFIDWMAAVLARHPDAPVNLLELEVLESAALSDLVRVAEVMEQCHALGLTFALDDFGTGFSSLSYLRRLPAETLKIDRSFVRDMLTDPNDTAIVESVISLAMSFRRRVVAEGVETPAHGLLLMRLGCDLAQGYAIAKPMPAAEIPQWWSNWQHPPEWAANATQHYAFDEMRLFTVEIEHRYWVDQLIAYLQQPIGSNQAPALAGKDCSITRWLGDTGLRLYGGRPSFANLVRVHQQLHQKAQEMHALFERDVATARAGIPELIRLRDELVATVNRLQDESDKNAPASAA